MPSGSVESSLARAGRRRQVEAPPAQRLSTFDSHFIEDLQHWVHTEPRVAERVLELVTAVMREPFTGIGKPEHLKHLAAGTWSRRITQEHRLVYRVTSERIDFLQARYHY
jgi:toxin YoeB